MRRKSTGGTAGMIIPTKDRVLLKDVEIPEKSGLIIIETGRKVDKSEPVLMEVVSCGPDVDLIVEEGPMGGPHRILRPGDQVLIQPHEGHWIDMCLVEGDTRHVMCAQDDILCVTSTPEDQEVSHAR